MMLHDFFDACCRIVYAAIVQHEDLKSRIIAREQSMDRALDHLFFVIGRYEHGHLREMQERPRPELLPERMRSEDEHSEEYDTEERYYGCDDEEDNQERPCPCLEPGHERFPDERETLPDRRDQQRQALSDLRDRMVGEDGILLFDQRILGRDDILSAEHEIASPPRSRDVQLFRIERQRSVGTHEFPDARVLVPSQSDRHSSYLLCADELVLFPCRNAIEKPCFMVAAIICYVEEVVVLRSVVPLYRRLRALRQIHGPAEASLLWRGLVAYVPVISVKPESHDGF